MTASLWVLVLGAKPEARRRGGCGRPQANNMAKGSAFPAGAGTFVRGDCRLALLRDAREESAGRAARGNAVSMGSPTGPRIGSGSIQIFIRTLSEGFVTGGEPYAHGQSLNDLAAARACSARCIQYSGSLRLLRD